MENRGGAGKGTKVEGLLVREGREKGWGGGGGGKRGWSAEEEVKGKGEGEGRT